MLSTAGTKIRHGKVFPEIVNKRSKHLSCKSLLFLRDSNSRKNLFLYARIAFVELNLISL